MPDVSRRGDNMKFGDLSYINGLRDVMEKITLALRLVEQIPCEMHHKKIQAKASEVLELLEEVRKLVSERTLWPMYIEEKVGMYCVHCGLVVYAEEGRQRSRCSRCGGYSWYFITGNWQPRVQFGTVQEHRCMSCDAVVYGDVKECPVCGGKLKQKGEVPDGKGIRTNLGPEGKKGNSTR